MESAETAVPEGAEMRGSGRRRSSSMLSWRTRWRRLPGPGRAVVEEPRRVSTARHEGDVPVERQRPAQPTVQTLERQRELEGCEIRLWRGFVKCQLYATFRGSDEAFAVSRYFRLRSEERPGAGAQRALADLLAELERGGWTVVSDGGIWYQHWLQRGG